ncbi:MAG: lasso peptide biosynthesis B2 protein [Pseudonocardiaceae bacterium]
MVYGLGEARLALFGCCLATGAELDAASARAVRSEDPAVLAELPRGCLLGAVVLLRTPFPRLLAIVAWVQRRTPRPANAQQAAQLVAAVAAAGRSSRGRVACLERSLAVTLLGALRRRRVDWCIGARAAALRRACLERSRRTGRRRTRHRPPVSAAPACLTGRDRDALHFQLGDCRRVRRCGREQLRAR